MIKRRSLLTMAAALWLLAGWSGSASADVTLFSNLGPPNTYDPSFGWSIGNGDNQVDSMEFTMPAGQSSTLAEIDVIAQWLGFASNSFVVSIETNNGGSPGTTLESWNTSLPNTPSLLTLTSTTPVTLAAGASYWVTMAAADPNTRGEWWASSTGATGPELLSFFFAGTDYATLDIAQGGFQVLGESPTTGTPEPSTALLAGLGALVLIARFVRRRRAVSPA